MCNAIDIISSFVLAHGLVCLLLISKHSYVIFPARGIKNGIELDLGKSPRKILLA
jgi:hypothetical protein